MKVMDVVEDVEVGCMGCVANKRKRMGANSIVSAQPALPSDLPGLPERLRRASAKRERAQQADPNAKKVEQEKRRTELRRVRGSP